ncbi:hypothetical protein [Croceicoccus sp. BE223]|uniref:hypothetical protein n=1 Tax=Croceicoccus sp. BE223 TaxID=2817716 RepID=UPI002862558C|nr:hypothetical protein [Croceicoccus sp. BE223]MDR7101752.1 hypothetical protein [Croceicoccus sp. BE223]
MTSRNRMQSVMWTGSVVVATALSLVLMLQVKAVNSEIAETEKAIVATKQQIASLETEFQTRSRQQQLVRWNEVDFGYVAPRADQFLDGRAELASLGKQVEIIDAQPVRMAVADAQGEDRGEVATRAAAPVRMASAEPASAPALKGEAEKPAIRLAQAETKAPAMMRQLVATDARIRPAQVGPKAAAKSEARFAAQPTAKPAVSAKPAASKSPAAPKSFAERFDLDSVIAEGKR